MRTPLREFVAGNLFDDLLVPDVQVLLLPQAQGAAPDLERLPALRTLRELMPGNVTRHFGIQVLESAPLAGSRAATRPGA